MLALLALLLISACGRTESIQGFEAQADAFVAAGSARGKTPSLSGLVIRFGSLESGEASAQCNQGTITVVENQWRQLDEGQKESLIFHELGHCLLGLPHRTDRARFDPADDGPRPISLMSPDALMGFRTAYQQHRSEYLDELFK